MILVYFAALISNIVLYRLIQRLSASFWPIQPHFDANTGKRLVGSVGQGKYSVFGPS